MINKVLCFGGRTYADAAAVDRTLTRILAGLESMAIINGGARGADFLCAEWGRKHGLCVVTVPAPWDHYGRAAGTLRNTWMLDVCAPTHAIHFPGGTGTAHMRRLLDQARVPVWLPL